MGNTWEVYSYTMVSGVGYTWSEVYRGQSMIKAILAAHRAKRYAGGLIKVEWR